jgi:succinoglycan biosynthesis transport protein ExoP
MLKPRKKYENPLQEYWTIVQKRLVWVVVPFVLTVLITMLYSAMQRVYYCAAAKIYIETNPPRLLDRDSSIFTYNKDYYQTQFEILKSRPILLDVIQKLQLDQKYPAPQSPLQKLFDRLRRPDPSENGETVEAARLVPVIQRSISISPLTNTGLVQISVNAPESLLARDITNQVIETFIQENLKARNKAIFDASDFFAQQLSQLNEKLQHAETELESFEKQEGLEGFVGWENLDSTQFSEYLSKYLEAKSSRWEMEERIRALRKLASQQNFVGLSIPLMKSETLDSLSQEMFQAEMELSKLRDQDYKEEHPFIQKAHARIALIKRQLVTEAYKLINSLEVELAVLRTRENNLLGVIQDYQQSVAGTNKKKAEHDYLTREKQIYASLYESYDQQLKKLKLFENVGPANIRVIENALPGWAVRPNRKFHLLIGILAGLTLGIALAFFREYLDNTIRTAQDVEDYLDIPVVGTIPYILQKDGGPSLLAPNARQVSVTAEAYRALRTSLQFFEADKPMKTILITSSGPSEGKTTTVANLGITLVQMGKKVCLVDMDLRKPALHKLFLRPNTKGITSVFSAAVDKKSLIQATGNPGLYMLASGPTAPNPAELIASARMRQVLEELRDSFDYVILDSPPLLAVTDARILATMADGILLVIQAGQSAITMSQSALEQVERAKANIIGAVLNKIRSVETGYYYYYYSKYYTSKNGTIKKKKKRSGKPRPIRA